MKRVNALQVRTKFGKVLNELKKEGEPILLSRGHEIEAVLVPIELFKERFVDFLGQEAIQEMIETLTKIQAKPKGKRPSQLDLRELRGSLS